MELDHLNNHQVHSVARFYAATAATINGHNLSVVGPRTRLNVDQRTVKVFSRRQPGSPWQTKVSQPVVGDAEAVVFVDLTGVAPDFYVAPAQWVRENVQYHHNRWLESVGQVRPRNPDSDHTAIHLDRIVQWPQRWDVLAAL